MLANRPDVRRAELHMKAAKMDVEAAKAAFYPSLSIEAGVGYAAFNPKHLVDTPDSAVFNLMGNVTAPLLNRAAIKAQYRTANAMQIQAVYNYERAMLQGYTDVVNQLAMIKNLQESYKRLTRQVDLLTRAVDVSNALFQSARADYAEVLLTRRDALEAEMQLIETKLQQFTATVNMYQALGGGWR
jgi:outer membrane protein TolC